MPVGCSQVAFVKLYENDSCKASRDQEGTGAATSPPYWLWLDTDSIKSSVAQIRCDRGLGYLGITHIYISF